jgi:predicted DNA-binding ribbon-helix-helix protein
MLPGVRRGEPASEKGILGHALGINFTIRAMRLPSYRKFRRRIAHNGLQNQVRAHSQHFEETAMKSLVVKRSVVIAGHRTSISLEDAFWQGLKQIATIRKMGLSELISTIDMERRHANLSSAIRLFVLDFHCSAVKSQESKVSSQEPQAPALSTGI